MPGLVKLLSSWAAMLCLLGFLWFTLINQVHLDWALNPQYSYGLVVPFLCLGLFMRRIGNGGTEGLQTTNCEQRTTDNGPAVNSQWSMVLLIALIAFLYLPTRLVQEANPEWRMVSWVLAIEVVGLTMLVVRLMLGSAWARRVAFPICFFLVAVPWPTIVEAPLIQLLTRVCASISVEVVGCLGIPAVQHGNLLEVATGTVGVDEACSGIRSFQSSLMISLFLGEFYGLALWRRIVLVPAGFLLALVFNVCRISFLTCAAARQGVPAIAKYHDDAGLTIVIACTGVLWLLSLLLRGVSPGQQRPTDSPSRRLLPPVPALKGLAFGLLLWLVTVEAGVELWYRAHEWRLPPSTSWGVEWPRGNPTFAETPISDKATWLLRYDRGVSASWREADATEWHMTLLEWLPGRVAIHLATAHTPDICFPAAGHTVETFPGVTYVPVGTLSLPFREYIVNEGGGPVYVFYCLWEDRAKTEFFDHDVLTYGTRLSRALSGQRNCGERSLEILVRGIADIKDARAALQHQLEKLINVKKSTEKSFAFSGQPIQATTTQKAGRELSENGPRTLPVP
jgi:exosortase